MAAVLMVGIRHRVTEDIPLQATEDIPLQATAVAVIPLRAVDPTVVDPTAADRPTAVGRTAAVAADMGGNSTLDPSQRSEAA